MLRIGVFEERSEEIAPLLCERLKSMGLGVLSIRPAGVRQSGRESAVTVISSSGIQVIRELSPQVLVVGRRREAPCSIAKTGAEHIIVPGGMPVEIRDGAGASVITYGMSARDTLTVSSVDDGGFVLSVQRDMAALGGELIERQEIPVARSGRHDLYRLMPVAAVLLLLGVTPERLPETLLGGQKQSVGAG